MSTEFKKHSMEKWIADYETGAIGAENYEIKQHMRQAFAEGYDFGYSLGFGQGQQKNVTLTRSGMHIILSGRKPHRSA